MQKMTRLVLVAGAAFAGALGVGFSEEAPVAGQLQAQVAAVAPTAADVEKQLADYFATYKSAKDGTPAEQEAAKKKSEEMKALMETLFDLKLKDVAEQAKADGYKAKKEDIVKANMKVGKLTGAKTPWAFSFEAVAPAPADKGAKHEKGGHDKGGHEKGEKKHK